VARAADTPVDAGVPAPTVQPGQSCGTSIDPAWRDDPHSESEPLQFIFSVPEPAAGAVTYQGVVRVWDLDDPTVQAEETTLDERDGRYQSLFVYLPLVDGHAYAWEVRTYDGASYSPATPTCYFAEDMGSPLVTSVTNPDFPSVDSGGPARKHAGQPTTFTVETAEVPAAGCDSADGPGCRVSGLRDVEYDFDGPLPYGGPSVPVDSRGKAAITVARLDPGMHSLAVRAVDGAFNGLPTTYDFFVPSELPPPATSTIHLTAPATSARTAGLTVNGQVSPGTYLPDEVVHVVRTDLAHAGGVALPDVPLSADGHFSFGDAPQVGGANTYRVSFAGDTLQAAATASATVQVPRATPALTLTAPAHTYLQNATPKVTAHLGSTYNGRTVAVYAQPVGGKKTLVKSGTVDAKGNIAVSYELARTTTFSAVFAGDYRYAPRTVSLTVAAAPHMSASMLYANGTFRVGSTAYRVYHRTQHQPVVQAKASLAQTGGCYQVTVWRSVSRTWKAVKTSGCLPVGTSGYAAYAVPWGSLPVNGLFQVRVHYSPPRTGAIGTAAWSAPAYFTVKAG
jgi:hypothetical protein